ncbi:MAG: immunoglobulin domain-containing protein, partial [Verrucomicrobiia bacterium]
MNGKTSIQPPHNRYVQANAQNRLERFLGKLIGITLVALFVNSAIAGQLTLTWNDNSDNENGFKVERSIDGETFELIGSVEADVATYLDATVVENQSYSYRPNDAPTVSSLSNVSILEGGNSGTILFSIGDTETNAADLTVVASSSNQSLLADSGIVLGGSGSARSFDLDPVSGASGSRIVTISVSDGTRETSESFTLSVQSITVPTISPIANVSITLGAAIDPIAFSIEDAETIADNLTLSLSSSNTDLLPTENISIEGTGEARTLIVTPIEGMLGVSTVTVTVGDGSGDAIETFDFAVQSSPVIRSQPVDTSEFIGGITALNIQVDAYPEPSYQWYFNGELIEGANEAELLF